MSHFPPPPQLPPKVGLFRRTPPAIFPAALGLLGLGIAWRRAVAVTGAPGGLVEAYLGGVTLVLAFCLMAYGAKVAFRPGVLREDAATLPGRTGLAALGMCLMAEGAVLAPYAAATARALIALGFGGLAVLALAVLPARLAGRDTSGPVTPALHLVFVGFIVAPLGAVPLGFAAGAMGWVVAGCAAAGVIVGALTLAPLVTGAAPEPLRPLQAIHLAPASLVATGAFLTGQPMLAEASLAVAAVLAALLLLRLRWLIAAGFSGFWSAFTFPVSAFAGALLLSGDVLAMPLLETAGALVLAGATLVTLPVAYRVMKLWAKGVLAAKTNAAIA